MKKDGLHEKLLLLQCQNCKQSFFYHWSNWKHIYMCRFNMGDCFSIKLWPWLQNEAFIDSKLHRYCGIFIGVYYFLLPYLWSLQKQRKFYYSNPCLHTIKNCLRKLLKNCKFETVQLSLALCETTVIFKHFLKTLVSWLHTYFLLDFLLL